MPELILRLQPILRSNLAALAALLAVTLAAYATGINRMGFYWDDWPMNWIAQNMGNSGLDQYFSTNRPVWGLLYQLTTPILGGLPLIWQIAALLGRFGVGALAWALTRQVWPNQRSAALWIGLVFIIYPGFMQQHVAFLYTHFYLVIGFWLGSLLCSALALRRPARFRLLTGLALLLSLGNLLMMEYFFPMELMRPLLILAIQSENQPSWRKRLRSTLKLWLPYLAVFIAAGAWRVFLFPYTQENYRMLFLEELRTSPLSALLKLAQKIISQNRIVLWDAWAQTFSLPEVEDVIAYLGIRGGMYTYWAILLGSGGFAYLVLLAQPQEQRTAYRKRWGWQALLGGLAALLLAGFPFWLTEVPFRLLFAFDRFTLPFMLGVGLVVAGLADLLPVWRFLRLWILAALVALAVNWQIQVGFTYIKDWQVQQRFFWMLTWRAPNLEPGTVVLSNELRIHPTDNSLSAPLNWIYAPGDNRPGLPYMLVYPSLRTGSETLPALASNQTVQKDYLVGQFNSNTNQAIGLYYEKQDCLRLLDPETDPLDPTLPLDVRQMAVLSNPSQVRLNGLDRSGDLIPGILSVAPANTWCQAFETASALRWASRWEEIAGLAEPAFKLAEKPHHPTELFPFIEAYAHLGRWEEALGLTQTGYKDTPEVQPAICALWQRIQREAKPDAVILESVVKMTGCEINRE